MSGKNIFLSFAPISKSFFIALSKRIIQDNKDIKIHGIFFSHLSELNEFKKLFPNNYGKLFFFPDLENKCFKSYTEGIDHKFEPGFFGKFITADRRIGTAYNDLSIFKQSKTRLLCKKNNLIQKNYFSSLYIFINEFLETTKIDYAIFNCVASSFSLMFSEICKKKSIQFITNRHSRIRNLYIFDYQNKTNKLILENTIKDFDNQTLNIEKYMSKANDIHNSYHNEFTQPEYSIFQNSNKKNLLFLILQFLYRLVRNIIKIRLNYVSFYNAYIDLGSYCRSIIQKKYIDKIDITNIKYIYYPLHVNPEASTMVEAPYMTDQLSILESISKSIPSNYLLVVKEHLPQLGKRKNKFYKKLKTFPNIKLIDPYTNPKDILLNSSLVITINGTVAMESIILNKPTVVLSEADFMVIGEGFIHNDNLLNLPDSIKLAFKLKSASKNSILKYICAVIHNSIQLDTGYLWGHFDSYDQNKKAIGLNEFYKRLKSKTLKSKKIYEK